MQYKNIIFDLGNVSGETESRRMHRGFQGDKQRGLVIRILRVRDEADE